MDTEVRPPETETDSLLALASVRSSVWAVVLAAGSGRRLQELTRDADGTPIPKQFCSLDGRRSMFGWALERAARITSRRRIVPVVAAEHTRWWSTEVDDLPKGNVRVQPADRGTAAGLLLPLTWIARRDPDATVVVLPSDHFVAREDVLAEAVRLAAQSVERSPERVILLGFPPRAPLRDLGWIVPSSREEGSLAKIEAFFEKPDDPTLAALASIGAYVNSMIVVARASALLGLYERTLPRLLFAFASCRLDPELLDVLYEGLPTHDFSRDVLQPEPDSLWVLPLPHCGWSDLGTPERVARHLGVTDPAMPIHLLPATGTYG